MLGLLGKSKGIELVMEHLHGEFYKPLDMKSIQKETGLSYERVYTSLAQLKDAGIVLFSKQKKSILAQLNPFSEMCLHYCIIMEHCLNERMKREQPVTYQVMHDLKAEVEKLRKKFVLLLMIRKDNHYDIVLGTALDETFQKQLTEIRHLAQVKHSCHLEVKMVEMGTLRKMLSKAMKSDAEMWRKKIVFHDIDEFWNIAFGVLKARSEKP